MSFTKGMSSEASNMGQTIKAKITFTCSHLVRELLDKRAKKERRTLSNLVEGMVTNAVTATVENINQLVAIRFDEASTSGVPNLEAIANGEAIPTKSDFCKIAAALGIEGEEKKRLWKATYKEEQQDAPTTNPARPTKTK